MYKCLVFKYNHISIVSQTNREMDERIQQHNSYQPNAIYQIQQKGQLFDKLTKDFYLFPTEV